MLDIAHFNESSNKLEIHFITSLLFHILFSHFIAHSQFVDNPRFEVLLRVVNINVNPGKKEKLEKKEGIQYLLGITHQFRSRPPNFHVR